MSHPSIAAVLEYIEQPGYDPVIHELDAYREVDSYLRSHNASASAVNELGNNREENE